MDSLKEQILLLISTPLYLIIIGLELLLSNYKHRQWYSWKDTAANIYLLLLNSAIDLLFRGVYILILDYCYRHHIFSFVKNDICQFIVIYTCSSSVFDGLIVFFPQFRLKGAEQFIPDDEHRSHVLVEV